MNDRLTEIAEMVARIASENSRLLQRLAENEHRFRRISMGVLRAQEAERRRISYELHDGVGQSLTALKIQLDLVAQSPVDSIGGSIEQLCSLANLALQDVRQLSRLLRPHMLDDLGLDASPVTGLSGHGVGLDRAPDAFRRAITSPLATRTPPSGSTRRS
jgi:signal transduction histidine kinase